MINTSHLTKNFGHLTAVEDVSFEVKEGENLVILGTSGCGKTTTLKMINRLIVPDSGRITVNGTDISRQSPEELRRGIGYVLQQNSLFPHFTVAQNIAVVPKLLNWDQKKIDDRIGLLLEKLHLPEGRFMHKYPRQLSGGQQQRVNLARALAADPPILLMDEPFGALDTVTRASISKEFSEISEFMCKTIVMVTHDIQEAFLIGDKICLMSDGRIVQIGKPEELLFQPANDFVRDFFASSYLRLALGMLQVGDVLDAMAGMESTAPAVTIINVIDTLWQVMEQTFNVEPQSAINIRDKQGVIQTINKEDLYRAISKAPALKGRTAII